MQLQDKTIRQLQKEILSWYKNNIRDLPWRPPALKLREDGTRDPYAILVSEVMSQQTQLSRVIPKYIAWMEELPTIESLASAKQSIVLRLWSGLGYNRRALFLQRAAQVIITEYKGKWPEDVNELEKLPGIGKYTAAAVACFAFNKQIPVVDTNVRKVILTQFYQNHPEPIRPEGSRPRKLVEGSRKKEHGFRIESGMTEEMQIYDIALQLLPKGKAYEWNQALMDYAAIMLKSEKIPVQKQSKFLGSKRFYRGKVLKLLVEHTTLSFSELWNMVEDTLAGDEEWFKEILKSLQKEQLIQEKNGEYFL